MEMMQQFLLNMRDEEPVPKSEPPKLLLCFTDAMEKFKGYFKIN